MSEPINDFTIKPFQFYCQYVLPLVYDQSLSYYEVLCKMQVKLNEVIASQNNLNEAFLALKNWIDTQLRNYTEAQLQEWLNDGTLEGLIAGHLDIPIMLDTVAEMKTSKIPQEGNYVMTGGYYAINDGGGAKYYITSVKDDTVWQETLSDGLYATLIIEEKIKLKSLGLTPLIDSTEKISKIINLLKSTGKYIIIDDNYKLNQITINDINDLNIIGENGSLTILNNTISQNIFQFNSVNGNITIKNVKFNSNGTSLSSVGGGGVIQLNNFNFIEINACEIFNTNKTSNANAISGSSNIFNIINCNFHDCGTGPYILHTNTLNINNCIISNMTLGINVGNGSYNNITGNIFINNISDIYLGTTYISNNNISIIDGNQFNGTIGNNTSNSFSILIVTSNTETFTPSIIANNIFNNIICGAISLGSTDSSGAIYKATNINIHDNIIKSNAYNNQSRGLVYLANTSSINIHDINVEITNATLNGLITFDGQKNHEIHIENINVENSVTNVITAPTRSVPYDIRTIIKNVKINGIVENYVLAGEGGTCADTTYFIFNNNVNDYIYNSSKDYATSPFTSGFVHFDYSVGNVLRQVGNKSYAVGLLTINNGKLYFWNGTDVQVITSTTASF